MTSTAIKLVGGLSAKDAATFSQDMQADIEFLQGMQKYKDHTDFACFVRNNNPRLFSLSIPFGTLEGGVKSTQQEMLALRDQNRARYCAPIAISMNGKEPVLEMVEVGKKERVLPAKPELL